jgi:hypothetical protein
LSKYPDREDCNFKLLFKTKGLPKNYSAPVDATEIGRIWSTSDGEVPVDYDLRIYSRNSIAYDEFQTLSLISPLVDPMVYPLFYVNGQLGWCYQNTIGEVEAKGGKIT